jgi:ABC-type multidrug transport system permease subunit
MNDFLSHIKGVLYRNYIWAYRSPFRLMDVTIWPLVMLFTLTLFFSVVGGNPEYLSLIIFAIAGWRAIFFVTFETCAMFIEEHWHRALPDLLVSPISTLQIAIGGALTGVLKAIAVVIIFSVVGYLVYGFVLVEPLKFILALVFLMLAGFSIGFVLFGLACYFDKRNVFTLGFILPDIIGLMSGPYYNVHEFFPGWLAAVLNTFPTTHAFNLIKSIFGIAKVDYGMLIGTSVVWLVLAIAINRTFYNMGRRKGTLTKVG